MALAGKMVQGTLSTAYSDLYIAPTVTFCKVNVSVANNGSTQLTFGLQVVDSSAATTKVLQPSTTPLPVGSSLEKVVILESGDKIQGIGENATDLDYTISATELT